MLGNYAEFTHLTSLFQTPYIVITMLLSMACLYLAKSGMETVGKWCGIMMGILVCTMLVLDFFSWPIMQADNLKPVMGHSVGELTGASLKLIPLPIGEGVVALALFGGIESGKGKSSYKLWMVSVGLSAVFLLEIFFRTCAILGPELMDTVYFPAYNAASLVKIGSFLERIEAFVAFVYVLAGTSKVSACLIAATRGAAKLFGLPSYKPILLPMVFTAMAFAPILFHSIVEMFDFIEYYLIYALLFQLVIPVLIWVVAEVKAKRNKLPAADVGRNPKPAAG